MNALTVAWKLRVDMLAILAAATPRGSERGSESSRRAAKPAPMARRQSDIQELLSSNLAAGADPSNGEEVSGELVRVSDLAAELEESVVIPASQRCPDIVRERQHA